MDEAFELQEPFEKDCINSLLGIMVSSNQELFDSIKNGGTGIMNEVLREFFKDEIKANEHLINKLSETEISSEKDIDAAFEEALSGAEIRRKILDDARKDALKDAKRAG